MRISSNKLALSRARQTLHPTNSAFQVLGYGRSAPYRRIHNSSRSPVGGSVHSYPSSPLSPLRSTFSPLPLLDSTYTRSFTTSNSWNQAAQPKNEPELPEKPVGAPGSAQTAQPKNDTEAPEKPVGAPGSEEASDPLKNTTADAEEAKKTQGDTAEEASSEKKEKEGKEEKKEEAPPPPHGDKTPWQVFMDTLQTEFKASKEWTESTKALQSGYQDFTQNPALQKAKSAYEEASKTASSTTSAALKQTGSAIGKGAAAVWESPVGKVVRKGATAAGSGLEKATRPVRDTDAYKSVKDVIDDGSSSRYGGWIEKEERRKRRAQREAEFYRGGGRVEKMEEDPDAGTNIQVHKDAAWKESWREFRQSSKLFKSLDDMKSVYEQSDNPLVTTARSWADTIGGFFAENETAMVIKKLREIDPNFQLEPFLIEMREYILPEVLDAYVKGDLEVLKQWLSAAQYNVYAALMQQYTTAGLKSDGRILDIRHVDVANARLLEPGDIPVFVITCRTQEVHVYKNKKTNELAAGVDDKVQQVTYAIGVTRIPEDVSNPETRGWRLIELQKSARDYY